MPANEGNLGEERSATLMGVVRLDPGEAGEEAGEEWEPHNEASDWGHVAMRVGCDVGLSRGTAVEWWNSG